MISEPGQTTNANCINRFATTSDDSLAAGAFDRLRNLVEQIEDADPARLRRQFVRLCLCVGVVSHELEISITGALAETSTYGIWHSHRSSSVRACCSET
jgi:hypothetical protein